MVIDDEEDLLMMARIRLESNGYDVMTLDSGERALEVIKAEKPDLILLDIVLAGKNGYDVCSELKEDKLTRGIPVIVFSAYYKGEEGFKKNSEAVWADDYILKPFESQTLLDKIKALIK